MRPLINSLTQWLEQHPFAPMEIDCVTTVKLKILDGKCKMAEDEKIIMGTLYDALKTRPGKLLGPEVHELIQKAHRQLDEAMRLQVYEQRLLAETMLSRPVMKAFKARIRAEGLIGLLLDEPADI
ncbi:MAG TPA: hypothetical protein PKE57_08850 [Cellvibrionaceae bacterium]|nr:hypothetical protein [Cellvibrionaceae bacterium]